MTQEEIKEILERHQHWLNEDCEGYKDMMADLSGADLRGAYLSGAYLNRADLRGADLRGAYLNRADLSGAYLSGAYLSRADLSGADLSGADLSDVKNMPHIPIACPTHDEFIGFKKAMQEGCACIVKLLIPADARRSSATGYKCRCDKAKVLDIESIDGQTHYDLAASSRDVNFKYIVGETVQVDNFDTNRFNECAPGIHFFVDKQAAIDYEI